MARGEDEEPIAEAGGGAAAGPRVGERAEAERGSPGSACVLGPASGRASRWKRSCRVAVFSSASASSGFCSALAAVWRWKGSRLDSGREGHRGWCGGGEAEQLGVEGSLGCSRGLRGRGAYVAFTDRIRRAVRGETEQTREEMWQEPVGAAGRYF